MIIKGADFVPAPEGVFAGVCVDVIDLGFVDSAFGKKHKVKVVWEIDSPMEDGRRFIVQKRYNVSLHDKATLAKDLKAWRGRPLTPEELKGFDLDKIIGVPCQLVIQHTDNEGVTYANVTNILKANQQKIAPSGAYIRVKDRPGYQPPKAEPATSRSASTSNGADGWEYEQAPEYDDIPF